MEKDMGGCPGQNPDGGAGVKAPAGRSGDCSPRISRDEFDWGNIIHFSQLSKGRKEQE